jgi:hypothetical protein
MSRDGVVTATPDEACNPPSVRVTVRVVSNASWSPSTTACPSVTTEGTIGLNPGDVCVKMTDAEPGETWPVTEWTFSSETLTLATSQKRPWASSVRISGASGCWALTASRALNPALTAAFACLGASDSGVALPRKDAKGSVASEAWSANSWNSMTLLSFSVRFP